MTHLFERTALILLAGTALTACGTPRYAVNPPLIALPPAAAPQAPPPQVATAQPEPALQPAPSVARVESRELAPLASTQVAPPRSQPTASTPVQASEPPRLAFAPPGEDAFARARSRAPAATYTVKRGDTLAAIADRLGSDIETVAKANDLKKPYRLQPGQVLKNPKAPKAGSRSARPAAQAEAKTYTVRPGDTLYAIAQRNGTSVEALRQANALGRSDSLIPGRKLKLPGAGVEETAEAAEDDTAPAERTAPRRPRADTPPSAAGVQEADGRSVTSRAVTGRVVDISIPGKSYQVKKGDNLERVAGRLDSDISELAKLNKLKKPYRLQPGQTIRGPGSSAKAYVVGRGDTVSEIARRFSVTEAELRSANGLRRGASVAPGRKLRLPAGYRDRGPITTTTRLPDRAEPAPAPLPSTPRPYEPAPRSPSSFDTPAPAGQILPPPRSAPRPPTVVMPDQPQPYRAPPAACPARPPRRRRRPTRRLARWAVACSRGRSEVRSSPASAAAVPDPATTA